MPFSDELSDFVDNIISEPSKFRDGQVVPETDDIQLDGGGVNLDATILYADLADSTELVLNYKYWLASDIMKSFLGCASKIIRHRGGHIRSFDGDRVMGIFIGDGKNSAAAKCALNIHYAFEKLIKPKFETKWPELKQGSYKMSYSCGIDTSKILAVRGGIRNNNDIVWVGSAPNIAAKLSNIREEYHRSYITKSVFDKLNNEAKYSSTNTELMWEARTWQSGKVYGVGDIYRSAWWVKP